MRQCPKCGKRFLEDHVRVCDLDASILQDVVVMSARDRLVNTVIGGRYEVTGVVGDGGMGVVYRARGIPGGANYAIKVLRAEYTSDEDLVQRFQLEAEAVARIQHDNIVKVFEFGTLPDQSRYFVMEFLEGASLGKLIQGQGKTLAKDRYNSLPEPLTLHIARQICSGLQAAHEVQIVHRDMKPDNVHLIPHDGGGYWVKVLDFGIAKVQGANSARTRTGSVFGTPHYMSPEQAQGERDIDPRTDVYAVGVLMYQMACGRVPFDADNLMGILTAHLYHPPRPPRTFLSPDEISEGLEAIILKALAKPRELRFQSMSQMEEDLARLERGEAPHALAQFEELTSRYNPNDFGHQPAWNVPDHTDGTSTVPAGRVMTTSQRLAVGRAGGVVPVGTGRSIPPISASKSGSRSRAPLIAAALLVTGIVTLGAAALVAFRHPARSLASRDIVTTQPPTAAQIAAAAIPPRMDATAMTAVPVAAPTTAPRDVTESASSTITLMSDPPFAVIFQNRQRVGIAPMEVPRPTDTDSMYVMALDGHMQVPVTLRSDTPRAVQITLPPLPPGDHSGRHHGRHGELLDPWSN